MNCESVCVKSKCEFNSKGHDYPMCCKRFVKWDSTRHDDVLRRRFWVVDPPKKCLLSPL